MLVFSVCFFWVGGGRGGDSHISTHPQHTIKGKERPAGKLKKRVLIAVLSILVVVIVCLFL